MPYTGVEHARSFTLHRVPLLELLETVPEDKAHFAAWEGGMDFVRLTDHIRGASGRLLSMVRGETPTPVQPSASLTEAREKLRQNTEEVCALLENVSPAQLEQTVTAFGGRQMPVAALLDGLREHDIHHKGQLWMMARMVGVQPPMFVKLG